MTTPHDSTADNLAETNTLGTDDVMPVAPAPQPVYDSTPYAEPEAYTMPRSPIENVLLIDGDNDPHVPPDARVTRSTLVRVFLRPGALLPRNLEKPLARLPNFCTVTSPKGGANAADFVMSLHAGMLHAVLPQSIPFLMVTNDATLAAMTAELQRLGRVATIWTSHPDAAIMSEEATGGYESAGTKPARNNRGRGGRSRGGGRSRSSSRASSAAASAPAAPATSAAPAAPAAAASSSRRSRGGRGRSSSRAARPEAVSSPVILPPDSGEPRKTGGKTLSEAAWTYSSRLQRIKDAPSRVKTLLNDIKNRAGSHGFSPEEILEELKRHHGVKVDAQGRVQVQKVKPSQAEPIVEDNA